MYGYGYPVVSLGVAGTGLNPPVNTVAPAITGTPQVGQTLTCSTGTWSGSPTSYAYQWKRNNANILGATSSTYTLVSADANTSVKCTVTATNGAGSASTDTNTVSVTWETDAQAFITAASITDPTQQSAVNQLVVDLKGYSLWTKMHRIYPFVGGSATSCRVDLKALTTGTFYGGWTYTNGALPNGTTGYFDTGANPSLLQITNSNGIGFHQNTTNTETSFDPVNFGAFDQGNGNASILATGGSTVATRLNFNLVSSATAGVNGHFSSQRTNATTTTIYKNGSSLNSGNSGGSCPNLNMFIGTLNLNGSAYGSGYTKNNFTFAYLSDGLNATEISNLNTAINTFNTTLGR